MQAASPAEDLVGTLRTIAEIWENGAVLCKVPGTKARVLVVRKRSGMTAKPLKTCNVDWEVV